MRNGIWRTAVAAASIAIGCGPQGQPVAELEARPTELELAWPEFVELEVAIEPSAELPGELARPTVFVHLLDEPGSVLRTFDHPYPGDWRVGREQRYRVRLQQSALAEPLVAGEYLVSMGVYDPEIGRFALVSTAEEIAGDEYRVATVHVPALDGRAPRARFSEHWLPPEAVGNRQVLVRRTLRGGESGVLQFGPIEGAGTLALVLLVPSDVGAGSRLELLDGAGQPMVRLLTSCGAGDAEISGTGRFDVDLEIPPDASGSCEVRVEPNFRLTTSERTETTSVRLESVSWRPAGRDRPPG
jgi:hypothetical protein